MLNIIHYHYGLFGQRDNKSIIGVKSPGFSLLNAHFEVKGFSFSSLLFSKKGVKYVNFLLTLLAFAIKLALGEATLKKVAVGFLARGRDLTCLKNDVMGKILQVPK